MEDIFILAIGAGVGTAAVAAGFILYVVTRRRNRSQVSEQPLMETVFLLRNGKIVDHTPDAPEILDRPQLGSATWEDLREALRIGFPELPASPSGTPQVYTSILLPEAQLRVAPAGKTLRVSLRCKPAGAAVLFRSASITAEFERLTDIAQNAPDPLWQTDADGEVIWYNDSYEQLCRDADQTPAEPSPLDLPPITGRNPRTTRVDLRGPDGRPRWYEVISRPKDEGWLHYASSIDTLVNAEMAQRNFVQTLTKTFAHLPIGLAVFDKDRQLVLFNPALVDLTNLPVDFLSARPNLLSFFDHMRENRMMPEPKNYASWRDKLYDVVSAAREDRYCETWNLPSGLTYKITGRPHPDGAVAFLVEDISAEISLTRRFRSELELTQSVLDCFEDSVAVFSRLGVLTFCNAAYREHWKCDPDSAFAEITIVDSTRDWQQACEPSPIWPELREFVLTLRDRSAWAADLVDKEGRRFTVLVEPVAAGATMVRFAQTPALTLVQEPRTSAMG